jgi:hypothetical protein
MLALAKAQEKAVKKSTRTVTSGDRQYTRSTKKSTWANDM